MFKRHVGATVVALHSFNKSISEAERKKKNKTSGPHFRFFEVHFLTAIPKRGGARN